MAKNIIECKSIYSHSQEHYVQLFDFYRKSFSDMIWNILGATILCLVPKRIVLEETPADS